MSNPVVLLADLVALSTQAEALGLELAVATSLGLSVTSWEPLDPSRTILQGNAEIISQYSYTVNLIAQGGFASYAATMVDANGNPITTWMDLLTPNLYYTARFQAGFAAGPVPVTNSSSTTQSYGPNDPIHFQYPTSGGATYTSVASGTIPANSSTTVVVVADAAFPGSLGNAATGTVLSLSTPLAGVSVQPLTQPLIGSPAESSNALLLRSQNKLGTLSALTQIQQGTTPVPPNPSAPVTAYDFVATSIAQSPTGSPQSLWPYYVSARLTRSQTVGNTSTGLVQQWLANASGPAPTTDVAVVLAAVLALTVGQCVTISVMPANGVNLTPGYTIYYRRGMGYTVQQAQTAILAAWQAYVSTIPIGGIQIPGTLGIVPFAEVEDVIYDALPGAIDLNLTLNAGTSYVVLGNGNVGIALSPSLQNVVFV